MIVPERHRRRSKEAREERYEQQRCGQFSTCGLRRSIGEYGCAALNQAKA